MFGFLFNSPAFQLIAQADFMIKVVLLILFSLSVFCLWVALCKFWALWQEKKAMQTMQKKLKMVKTFDDLLNLGKEYRYSVAGKFLIKALTELKDIIQKDESGKDVLTSQGIEHLQLMLDQTLDHVLAEQEQYLPVLSTSAAVAPLMGLFGTVWGLVHAFVNISHQKSADISVVAPGIAEALTTTLAGLIVAIPALVFSHYFSNEIRKLEQKLWLVSDRFFSVVKNAFL